MKTDALNIHATQIKFNILFNALSKTRDIIPTKNNKNKQHPAELAAPRPPLRRDIPKISSHRSIR